MFETLLVAHGHPVAVERHLARLSRSVSTLYGWELSADLADRVCQAAARLDHARMRVDFQPEEAELTISVRPVGPRSVPVHLIPRSLPGGLGGHKWTDRRLVDSLSRSGEPVLCDLDGLVLETARGNLFAVDPDDVLLTAPADGRILPGVTRARVLELAETMGLEVHVEPLPLTTLERATELFVTGAIGGIEAAYLEGNVARAGGITSRLTEALEASSLTAVASF